MINNVTLVGRLAADPELRYTPNGTAVVSFRLAVNRKYKNEDGERAADFIPCVAWAGLAETIAEYAGKGKEIAIEGEIRQNSWTTETGEIRSKLEVYVSHMMFLRDPYGSKNRDEEDIEEIEEAMEEEEKPKRKTRKNTKKKKSEASDDPFADDGKPLEIDDDDLPF